MKKSIKLLVLTLALMVAVGVFSACQSKGTDLPSFKGTIHFNEKYVYEYTSTISDSNASYALTFSADGNGQYEVYHSYTSDVSGKTDVSSYTINFKWQQASNGAVYLFKTDVTVHPEDNSEKDDRDVPNCAIYFSEDFLVLDYGDDNTIYVRENSDLADLKS